MVNEVPFVVVFADGRVRHFRGEVRSGAMVHGVVEDIAAAVAGLKGFDLWDYEFFVDRRRVLEYSPVGNSTLIAQIKIVSKMPHPG